MPNKTMNGLWWVGEKNDLSFREDITEPEISSPKQVKIKVAFSGVCGSDIHYMNGTMGKVVLKSGGMVMGHEFSGTAVEVGPKSKFKVGDRICVNPNSCCGKCEWNRDMQPHFCPFNRAVGVQKDGGWAQFCVVDDDQVYKLPDNVTLQQGALGEPYSCVLHGWKRIEPRPPTHARVLIQGAGIIGSMFCTMLHLHGYNNVTISELNEERRKLCQDMNLGYNVVAPQDVDAMFLGKDVDTLGFHLVIDCTGNTIAVKKAFEVSRRGGKVLIFGCCAAGKTIPMEPYQLYWKELTVIGAFINPLCFDDTMALLKDLEPKGYLEYGKLGVQTFSANQFKKALESIKSGSSSKAMFMFEE